MPLTTATQGTRRPAGYLLLRQRHAIACLPHHVESYVTHSTRQTYAMPMLTEEVYPRSYWPGDTDFDHLEFALKREGLHLQLLRTLLPRLPACQLTAYIQSKPTSSYARRIWFLYEGFSGRRLDLPDVTVTVACSGGTYIRSLAADLGRRLGTGAHLKTLRRLGSGSFTVDRALDSGTLESPVARETLEQEMIPLEASLPDMQEVQVDEAAAARIRQGYQPQWEELRRGAGPPREAEGHVKIVASDGLVAVMKTGAAGAARSSRLKAVRIFHPSNPY